MLLGSVLPFPGLYELLDSLEVAVRDDDLSLGRRLFDHPLPSGGTALERVARSMLERSPGATKYHDNLQRGVAQARAARRAGLRHAVMCVLKFCDPWAWDYPAVRDTLEEAGVGTLLVELAGGEDLSGGPVRNRVEAYFEMDGMGDLFDG
jgi:benzoyl-CoA reductase/2-hydroxyglutaryl-CoA dehydratase subunit BcrC/BadD/HgdB